MWFVDTLGPAQPVSGMPEQLVIHTNLIGDQSQDVPLQNAARPQNPSGRAAAPEQDTKKKKGWF